MEEIIDVLCDRVKNREDTDKNEIYYTQKQKNVLKTIANNPHKSASEVADLAGVHPSYIPYIIERVDEDVVDNLHRLEEYLSEREEMHQTEGSSVQETRSGPDESTAELMETFGATPTGGKSASRPTMDDRHRVDNDVTEFTITRELPVEITIQFPHSEDISQVIEADPQFEEIAKQEIEAEIEKVEGDESDESDTEEETEATA